MKTFIKTSTTLKAAVAAFEVSVSVSMSFAHCLGHRWMQGSEASAWRRLVRHVARAILADQDPEWSGFQYPWKSYGPEFIRATSVLKGIGYGIEKLPEGFRSWIQVPEWLEDRSLHKELLADPEWVEVSEDTLPTVRDWELEEWCDGLGLSTIAAFQAWDSSIANPTMNARKEAIQSAPGKRYHYGIDTFEQLRLPRAETQKATELSIASLRLPNNGVVRRGFDTCSPRVGVNKYWVEVRSEPSYHSELVYIRTDRTKAWDGNGYPLPIKEYGTYVQVQYLHEGEVIPINYDL
jgi:hypothetical protein